MADDGGTAAVTVPAASSATIGNLVVGAGVGGSATLAAKGALTVCGDAFLYNMVRIIAGTVAEIGLHRLEPDAFQKAFETKDRLALGMTAPAHGLELTKVFYPDEAFVNPAALRWHE